MNLTIHKVKGISTKGIKEWKSDTLEELGDSRTYYSVDIVIDYEELGDNFCVQRCSSEEDNKEQFGYNQNSFTLTLYAKTLEALEVKIQGVNFFNEA